jgi:PAS domain S-box-containing protein
VLSLYIDGFNTASKVDLQTNITTMKLRFIIKLLALSAFLSATLAGYVSFFSIKSYFQQEANRQALSQVQTISRYLAIFSSQYARPAVTLAGMPHIQSVLIQKDLKNMDAANSILDHFNTTLGTDVCYLMDRNGTTIASSNRYEKDSFVGGNFSFRPYFKEAISGNPFSYLALGTTSKKRGLYNSYPVYIPGKNEVIGVVVIKASMVFMESKVGLAENGIIMITDPNGVIFVSNRPEWLYHFAWPLTSEEIKHLGLSHQFGDGPWHWVGLTKEGDRTVRDKLGRQYSLQQVSIENFPGWKVIQLQNFSIIASVFSNPLIRITAPVILLLYLSVGVAIFLLYRKAGNVITERESAQRALRESEKRYRGLYHNTPAMLHSIGSDGRIISISDYWGEVLGYDRDHVIGRRVTDFLTPESRQYAEQVVIPEFFKNGFCKDVPYKFVKRNGELMDVLLSATSERNEKGETYRSLAVSIDVTERIKAEKALQAAQEKLSHYTRNLERKVRKRTGEITSLLKYTPAVVYMKDFQGRYMLVNSCYEKLFGVHMDAVRNKTDHEVLPKEVADQFKQNDSRVLMEKHSFQVEESIRHKDELHTYLSVKFPIYNGEGAISGVGGIATDITDLKNARDQLVRLSGSFINSQEKERAYLARELHDELGQVLTVLNMDAVWLQKRLKQKDNEAYKRAEGMHWLIDQTIEDVRNMSLRIRPGVLDHLGLLAALEWYTEDYQRRTNITCIFNYEDVSIIDGAVATAAYRIVQEALTNVARHSGAKRVKVSLLVINDTLRVTVEDGGRGFQVENISKFEGLGIVGMRERAALVRGKLEVTSRLKKGTRVELNVPLE